MNIKRVIAAAALTVVPLTVSSTALAAPAAPQGAPAAAAAVPAQVSADGAQYANTVLNKVNELRSSLGRQPDFTSAYPAGWTTGSENVAWRTAGGDTGALIFDQWLNSPGHYKNMTDPNVNSIGIGFAQTSNGRWYATQNFAAYNVSNSTLTPSTTTTTNTTTTTTKSNTPPKTNDNPPADTPATEPTPETTSSTPSTETTAPAPTAPPTSETTTPASTPSAPATTVTTETVTTTGTPAKPSATPVVAAPRTTPTKPALATTGPSIAVAVAAAGLLGTGAVLVMRRRQAS